MTLEKSLSEQESRSSAPTSLSLSQEEFDKFDSDGEIVVTRQMLLGAEVGDATNVELWDNQTLARKETVVITDIQPIAGGTMSSVTLTKADSLTDAE